MNVRSMSNEKGGGGGGGGEEARVMVNRNSLEEDEDSDSSDDPFNDPDVEDDVISAEFEAFSDTDTETRDPSDHEVSDTEAEAELLDQFDEVPPPPRRSSCDDILEAVQAVKLNYSFPFQDAR